MRISRETVRTMARLAQVELTDEAEAALTRDLEALLAFTACLDTLDTDGVDAADATGSDGLVLRDDGVLPWPTEPDPTAEAPGARDRLFRVPPAIPGSDA